jgi:hypothetical protein
MPARSRSAGCWFGTRSRRCSTVPCQQARETCRRLLMQLMSTQAWSGCHHPNILDRMIGLTTHLLAALTLTWQQTQVLQLLHPDQLAYVIVSRSILSPRYTL